MVVSVMVVLVRLLLLMLVMVVVAVAVAGRRHLRWWRHGCHDAAATASAAGRGR
jgi:hypothetical protein